MKYSWSIQDINNQIELLRHLRIAVFEKVVPAFESVPAEATALGKEILRSRSAHGLDEETRTEDATDAAFFYRDAMLAARQTLLNGIAIVLHHVVEQQVARLRPGVSFEVAKEQLAKLGVHFETLPGWPAVFELRSVANAGKHAEGPHAKRLRQEHPDLFPPSPLSRILSEVLPPESILGAALKNALDPTRKKTEFSLSGSLFLDLVIGPQHLKRYFDGIESFLTQLAEDLGRLEVLH